MEEVIRVAQFVLLSSRQSLLMSHVHNVSPLKASSTSEDEMRPIQIINVLNFGGIILAIPYEAFN